MKEREKKCSVMVEEEIVKRWENEKKEKEEIQREIITPRFEEEEAEKDFPSPACTF